MNRLKLTSLIAIATLGTFAHAGAIKPFEDTYSFVPVMKVNDVLKMKATADFEMSGQSIQFKATMKSVVKALDDKSYTVEQVQDEVSIIVGGNDLGNGGMEPTPTSFTFDIKGLLKEIKASREEFSSPEAYRAGALEIFSVPDAPVKMGESWSYVGKAEKNKWNAFKIDYKLVAREKIGDWDCVKVEFKAKETEGTDPAASEGNIWLNVTDYSVCKKESKYSKFPIPGAPMPLDGKMILTRVP